MLKIYTYNAGKGECIRIEYGEGTSTHNIVIDTGVTRFSSAFRSLCSEMTSHDILILTHMDDDHIGCILQLLRSDWICPFKEVRMNKIGEISRGDAYLSTKQNDEVYSRLIDQGVTVRPMFAGEVLDINNAILTALSPKEIRIDGCRRNTPLAYHRDYGKSFHILAEEPIHNSDNSINNRNSIVFVFEFEGRRLLFTGDALAEDVYDSAAGMQCFDLVKLPHHGSVGNIDDRFPEHINSQNFLICTDGVMHPDKQTIAKLIKWYGKVNVFSPSDWWRRGFFTDEDDSYNVNLIHKEGLVIEW